MRHGVDAFLNDRRDRHLGPDEKLNLIGVAQQDGSAVWEEVEDKNFDLNKQSQKFYDLTHHPVHQQAIARITIACSILEYHLCTLYTWMLHAPPPHAAATYYAIKNNHARLKMIEKLLPWLHSDQERRIVKMMLEICDTSIKTRNRYCHNPWHLKNGQAVLVSQLDKRFPDGRSTPVSAEEISDDATEFERTVKIVSEFSSALTRSRPITISLGAIKPSFAQKFQKQNTRPQS